MNAIYFCNECISYLCTRRIVSVCPACKTNDIEIIYDPKLYRKSLRHQMFKSACKLISLVGIIQYEDLPLVEIQVTDGQGCAICLSEYELGEEVKQLQCEHKFHEDCLKEWSNEHDTCPLCSEQEVSNCTVCGRDDIELTFDPRMVEQPLIGQMSDILSDLTNRRSIFLDAILDMNGAINNINNISNRINMEMYPLIEVNQVQEVKDQMCSICISNFALKEKIRRLHCAHMFHEVCLRNWLTGHFTCPLCRAIIS